MSDNTEQVQTETPPTQESNDPVAAPVEGAPQEGEKTEPPAAKEKSPEEIERIRLNRKIERLVQQRGELRARLEQFSQRENVTQGEIRATNTASPSDNETLQLTRADLQKLIDQKAREIAPTIKEQEAEFERRSAVVKKLASDWGQEKFNGLAADLDEAFDGLTVGNRPKPAVDAIFESDDPRSLIEYLADPDHVDEAEALSRMSAIAAARAITKLEAKLAADRTKAKPQPSKVAAPIEPLKGQGKATEGYRPDMSDADFARWRRKSIAQRR
jgi:hypothetical protein